MDKVRSREVGIIWNQTYRTHTHVVISFLSSYIGPADTCIKYSTIIQWQSKGDDYTGWGHR